MNIIENLQASINRQDKAMTADKEEFKKQMEIKESEIKAVQDTIL